MGIIEKGKKGRKKGKESHVKDVKKKLKERTWNKDEEILIMMIITFYEH